MTDMSRQLVSSQNKIAELEKGYQAVLEFIDKMEHLGQFQDRLDITCDVERIWDVLSREVTLVAAAEVTALFMVDDATHQFVLKGVSPDGQEAMCRKEIDQQVECGTFSWIINRRQPSIIPSLAFKENRTIIMLPLATARKTLGSLMLLTPIKDSAITQETLKLLGMLARQCALVMENSLLYDSLRNEHESLKQAQAQILQAEKLASIGRLTSGAFHEILNPLHIISGYIQMMQLNPGPDAPEGRYLKVMKQQADRIAGIVHDLMKFSRFPKQHVSAVSINHVIGEAIAVVEQDAAYDKMSIVRDFASDLPAVTGDAENLSQVFFHLLSNARDAMPPEGGLLHIMTRTGDAGRRLTHDGDRVQVRFKDDGRGIPEADIQRIFDPFFTTKEAGEGTGLGLSLSYGIIKEHAGQIRVESEPEGGTTFVIDFPVAKT